VDPGQDRVSDPSDGSAASTRSSAMQWEREIAAEFFAWRRDSGSAVDRMRTFASAVHGAVTRGTQQSSPVEIAALLPRVLSSCDDIGFHTAAEVCAYAALHLVDRYGRVLQVLEHLFEVGRLPLRRAGVSTLEVGAGPAPALYAIHDFYDDLVEWPGRSTDWSIGPVRNADALDKASGWDGLLHRLSEELMTERGNTSSGGQLPFARRFREFEGFDVHEVHHASIASLAWRIEEEFDSADEWVSRSTALKFAYEEGTDRPSGYDLVFIPNFLTRSDSPQEFRTELRGIMRALTPGGVLVVLCGVANQYLGIRAAVEALARDAGLIPVGPSEPMQSNADAARHTQVIQQVRTTMAAMTAGCSRDQIESLAELLPGILNTSSPFKLPRFCALMYVRQTRRRGRRAERAGH